MYSSSFSLHSLLSFYIVDFFINQNKMYGFKDGEACLTPFILFKSIFFLLWFSSRLSSCLLKYFVGNSTFSLLPSLNQWKLLILEATVTQADIHNLPSSFSLTAVHSETQLLSAFTTLCQFTSVYNVWQCVAFNTEKCRKQSHFSFTQRKGGRNQV